MYANIRDTLFDQKSPVHRKTGFPQRHKHTTDRHRDLETEWDKWADSVKKKKQEPRGTSHGLEDYLDHIWRYLEQFRAI